ncbi:MAG: sulfotransferase [Ktedonobacteraceae bacterium]|nr:sulfotransferase [Ktedonobacteraceae bacterium]
MNKMPNFFIVGAARSGTTSLDQYFRQHPEIYMAPNKEMHYFAVNQFPSCFKGPGDESLNKMIVRDEVQYRQFFANTAGKKVIGEASAFYLCFPGTAEQIAQAVPDAKIIVILREPVARAYSAYMLLVRDGRETLGFAESLSLEEERKRGEFEPMWWYRELSLYYKQVKRYLDVFGTQQVKVVLYDELFTNSKSVLWDIFNFLGVKEDVAINTSIRYGSAGVPRSRTLYTFLDNVINNQSPFGKYIKSLLPLQQLAPWAVKALEMSLQPVPIDSQTHAQLKEYFAEDVRKLEDLLHRDLLSWH